uniref:DUF4369 domain-containing protein n=3 Tax=unclassified Prevotella TaxID=2638335 RepID=A0AB33IQC5_9BACT
MFLLLLLLSFGVCTQASKDFDEKLREKIRGSWCFVGDPGYCAMQIEEDSIIWVDIAPDHSYAYTIVDGVLKTSSPNEAALISEPISFAGDTLIIGVPADEEPVLRLLPFSTISIRGKRVKIPYTEDALWEEEFNALMESLNNQPLSGAILNEWNTLGLFTDGAVAETYDNYLADLYMKHPQVFLDWIYNHQEIDSDSHTIRTVIMGGGEEIVGYPTKLRVQKDINNIKNLAQKRYLITLLNEWKQYESTPNDN